MTENEAVGTQLFKSKGILKGISTVDKFTERP